MVVFGVPGGWGGGGGGGNGILNKEAAQEAPYSLPRQPDVPPQNPINPI